MILEFLESLLTPATPLARSMGFLKSAIQVRSRHARCHHYWLPHLENTKALILKAASLCTSKRKVVLLGAGLLHDIPLRELSEQFEQVLLVDIVHPLSSRIAAWRLPNVKQINLDVTGVMEQISIAQADPKSPLPVSLPDAFCGDSQLDLTVSVNLISQLSWISEQLLKPSRSEKELDSFHRQLIEAHLDYLRRLPGHSALVTDVCWIRSPLDRKVSESWNVLHDVPLPPPTEQWIWEIAPAPERERNHDFHAEVWGYPDWKQASPVQKQ